MTAERRWRPVDGVLLLDKPVGLSSNIALQKARRLFQAEKAGHMGTLDPFASGLLPVCFGEATKFSRFVLDADKSYRATLRLGTTTTTGDPEGDTLETRDASHVTREAVDAALARFLGPQQQIPPRHAALKYQGRAYYDYARAGIDIPREPRSIEVHTLALTAFEPPSLTIDTLVSKGTYIRTLAEDIGNHLGCGAHLTALRRLHSGLFSLTDAHTLEALAALLPPSSSIPRDHGYAALDACLLPVETLVQSLPRLALPAAPAARLTQGQRLPLNELESFPADHPDAPETTPKAYSLFAGNRFLGVAEVRQGVIHPLRLMNTAVSD